MSYILAKAIRLVLFIVIFPFTLVLLIGQELSAQLRHVLRHMFGTGCVLFPTQPIPTKKSFILKHKLPLGPSIEKRSLPGVRI